MQWLSICVLANILLVVTAKGNQLRCQHSASHTCSKNGKNKFFLDRHNINIKYDEENENLAIDCKGWKIFESESLPRFSSEFYARTVKLTECPLPESLSIVGTLNKLNIHFKNASSLTLKDLPATTSLSASHFTGLEYMLTGLEVKAISKLTISRDVLSSLAVLQTLKLVHVAIEDESHSGKNLDALLKLPLINKLQLVNWNEKELAPLENCNNLVQLDLFMPNVETLPDRWVAACPKLEKITLKSAENLESLPSGLLEGASVLKRITITRCMGIKSLPNGIFSGTPHLIAVDLSHNKFETFSREIFAGVHLHYLSVAYNRLVKEALDVIGEITSLNKLDVSNNEFENICYNNGYSPLQKLTQLKELSLKQTRITQICRDWRENMTLLESLDLRETEISKLTYNDIVKYTRDPSVKNAELILDDASIVSVPFTEEDYNNAQSLTELPVKVPLSLDDIQCNCEMYWTRKAIDVPSITRILSLDEIRCNDGTYLKDKTLEQVCPHHK